MSSIEVHRNGEPVVLLHCSGSSRGQWRALVERLDPHYRVIAPDLYGYGAGARWPGRQAFSLEHEAAPLAALLQRVGEPVHLVGHSYGGAVALHIARTCGARVRSLTLIEPVAFHVLRGGDLFDAIGLREINDVVAQVHHALACGDYAAGYGHFVDFWSGAGTWEAISPARRDALAAQLPKVALDFHAALHEPAQLDAYRSVAMPTLILCGDRSVLAAQRICERLSATLRGARVATVRGAGHMLPLTHRDEVNDLIVTQLEQTAQPRVRAAQEDLSTTVLD